MACCRLLIVGLLVLFIYLMIPVSTSAQPLTGADLSHLPELESLGATYIDGNVERDCLDLFDEHGWRIVRLRLWHTPDWNARYSGLDSTLVFAQRVKQDGFELMLDFHYSDWWADPGQQNKPAAWEGLAITTLIDSVYAYTFDVMTRFHEIGATPDYVQLGNEISPGMVFPEGKVGWQGSEWDTDDQWANLTMMLHAGSNAVQDAVPEPYRPEILLHIADGANNAHSRWWFDNVTSAGVNFDVLAFSYYPWWHGVSLDDLEYNLTDMVNRYDKPVMIVESNYPFTLGWNDNTNNFVGMEDQLVDGYPASPMGQLTFYQTVVDIVDGLPDPGGLGFLLWEPEFIAFEGGLPNPMENLAVFGFNNEALPSLALPLTLQVHEKFPSPQEYHPSFSDIWIYPNPANANASLILPATGGGSVELQIVNLLGQTIHQESLIIALNERQVISLPVASISSGKYWVQTMVKGERYSKPIVIVR
jgi:arabinogalactan endo-1,4-beta-galactosidase